MGLQRERVHAPLAGSRTFALITVLGAVSGLLALNFSGWIVGFGALTVAATLIVGNLVRPKGERFDPGMTTEVAALLMYGVGAYLVVGHAPWPLPSVAAWPCSCTGRDRCTNLSNPSGKPRSKPSWGSCWLLW